MLFLSGLPGGYIQTAFGTTVAGVQAIQQNGTCTGVVTDRNGETVIGGISCCQRYDQWNH